MKKIASFTVDHTVLSEGIYLSRVDGDVYTYDVRMKKPNGNDYLDYPVMHTIEHLFATFARNSKVQDKIIYVGPMGCRTGFYFLIRDPDPKIAIEIIKDSFNFIANFQDVVPGTTAIECGNYLEHDLEGAKKEAKKYYDIIKNYTEKQINY